MLKINKWLNNVDLFSWWPQQKQLCICCIFRKGNRSCQNAKTQSVCKISKQPLMPSALRGVLRVKLGCHTFLKLLKPLWNYCFFRLCFPSLLFFSNYLSGKLVIRISFEISVSNVFEIRVSFVYYSVLCYYSLFGCHGLLNINYSSASLLQPI